jgi:hypothetical protein
MPKATIDKHRYPRVWKYNVDCPATTRKDLAVKAEAKTAAVQLRAEGTLARIVPLSRSRHPSRRGGRDRIGEFNIARHS